MKMNKSCRFLSILSLFLLMVTAEYSQAQEMVNPNIDQPNQPFCYYSKPTDELGVINGQNGTMVTPEGYIGTGFGTLVFFYGDSMKPVNQRVRTFKDGYIPVIKYHFTDDGINYKVTAFAATLDGNPESPMMNFIRVELKNCSIVPKTAYWGTGTRYQNELNHHYRGRLPVIAAKPGDYEMNGADFNPRWSYQFYHNTLLRSGDVMYVFPEKPEPQKMMRLNGASDNNINQETPVGIVKYKFDLKPGQTAEIDFKMPYTPIKKGDKLVSRLVKASFDEYLHKTIASWKDIIERGTDIQIPEKKVNDTFKASLVYDLMARNKEQGFYVQHVNDFQYHAFWLRDGAFITRMYDLTGYPEIAKENLELFGQYQDPNGNFISRPGQYDGWGDAVFAYGQHFRLSHDTAFARQVYPRIIRAFDWLKKARAEDPLHLIPKTNPHDNEQVTGHITGQNFLALAGLKNVIPLADALGKNQEAETFQKEYDDYYDAFYKQLKKITSKTDGYIPPAVDVYGGDDWGNLMADYPAIILNPNSRMVTATLINSRNKYQEGIMTYHYRGVVFLHDYLTFKNTETEVVRGDQEMALNELYATLVHTGSANDGFEHVVTPWKDRDPHTDFAPHGWFAAEYRTLIRNMMVREQGKNLHLFSVVSPDWIVNGKTIKVLRAPTYFGQVNMQLHSYENSAVLTMNNHFLRSNRPDSLILHLPWFMKTKSVLADGKNLSFADGKVVIPVDSREIDIKWVRKADTPTLNFKNAVKHYLKEYRKRYYEFNPKK